MSKQKHAQKTFHLDKRAGKILAIDDGGSDDDLLTTREMATWFGCSEVWLEIGRVRGYGPRFTKISPRMIRYRRGDGRAYLRERTHAATSEYRNRPGAAA